MKRIPVITTGILFFALGLCASADVDLAADLFGEENWAACRTESLRVLQSEPENESARLFAALAALRLGIQDGAETCRTSKTVSHSSTLQAEALASSENIKMEGGAPRRRRPDIRCLPALSELEALASAANDREVMAAASYECGRMAWRSGNSPAAYAHFKKAFETTASHDLFLRSGCSLYLLTKVEKSLRKKDAALALQLQTSRNLWSRALMKECGLPKNGGGVSSLPGKWIVAFYRSQIGPAIGDRCSLTPSCSEYFRQACRAHGLLGFAIQADRFFREPSEVAAKKNPVPAGDIIKYADPLEDHTGWLKK